METERVTQQLDTSEKYIEIPAESYVFSGENQKLLDKIISENRQLTEIIEKYTVSSVAGAPEISNANLKASTVLKEKGDEEINKKLERVKILFDKKTKELGKSRTRMDDVGSRDVLVAKELGKIRDVQKRRYSYIGER